LHKVLAIDPGYAPAWAALAENLYHETGQGLVPNKEGFAQAGCRKTCLGPEKRTPKADPAWPTSDVRPAAGCRPAGGRSIL